MRCLLNAHEIQTSAEYRHARHRDIRTGSRMTARTEKGMAVVLQADAVMHRDGLQAGHAILVEDGVIRAIGPAADIVAANRSAERIELKNHVLMPGFVNAHQHGEGLTPIQLGFPDDVLELWLGRMRRRDSFDPYWMTALAALEMASNGVTSTIHANTPYGTGDFVQEIRSFARAYETVGMRAMVGLGARDRGELVYPDRLQDAFLQSLPADLRTLVGDPTQPPLYAGDAAATIRVMETLQHEYADSKLISFAYAPAGPQWVSDRLLAELAGDAAQRNVAIHMHGLESHAQAVALAADYPAGFLKHLETLGVLSHRLSLAHAVWLTADDVDRVVANRVTLVRNPGSNLRLRAGVAPLAHYLKAGVTVALGSDSTTLNDDEDLFKEARLAMNLARSPLWNGDSPRGPRAYQRMTTEAGAGAMLLGDRTGTLAVGMQADIIAVSLDRIRGVYLDPDIDLATALYARALGSDVSMTMVGGRIIYRDGKFPLVDRDAIVAHVVEDARRTRIDDRSYHEAVERLLVHIGDHYRRHEKRLDTLPWIPLSDTGLRT
jgi:5-methylthioadenosine/S-adenosylhomocysteine deaminase